MISCGGRGFWTARRSSVVFRLFSAAVDTPAAGTDDVSTRKKIMTTPTALRTADGGSGNRNSPPAPPSRAAIRPDLPPVPPDPPTHPHAQRTAVAASNHPAQSGSLVRLRVLAFAADQRARIRPTAGPEFPVSKAGVRYLNATWRQKCAGCNRRFSRIWSPGSPRPSSRPTIRPHSRYRSCLVRQPVRRREGARTVFSHLLPRQRDPPIVVPRPHRQRCFPCSDNQLCITR